LRLKDKLASPKSAAGASGEGPRAVVEQFLEVDFSHNEASLQRMVSDRAQCRPTNLRAEGKKGREDAYRDQPRPPADRIARVA
jgi:hypothetical protein